MSNAEQKEICPICKRGELEFNKRYNKKQCGNCEIILLSND